MTNEFQIDTDTGSGVMWPLNVKPDYAIYLSNDDGVTHTLDFNGDTLKFTGNADEAAQLFVDWVGRCFEQRLRDEYLKGLNDAVDVFTYQRIDGKEYYAAFIGDVDITDEVNELRNPK